MVSLHNVMIPRSTDDFNNLSTFESRMIDPTASDAFCLIARYVTPYIRLIHYETSHILIPRKFNLRQM